MWGLEQTESPFPKMDTSKNGLFWWVYELPKVRGLTVIWFRYILNDLTVGQNWANWAFLDHVFFPSRVLAGLVRNLWKIPIFFYWQFFLLYRDTDIDKTDYIARGPLLKIRTLSPQRCSLKNKRTKDPIWLLDITVRR